MRKFQGILLFLIFISKVFISNAQDKFTIHAKFENISSNNVAILIFTNGMNIENDTIPINNGEFSYQGTTLEPQRAFLYITHDGFLPKNISNNDHTTIYLEKGNINIQCNDSLKNAIRSGTALNNDQQEFINLMQPIDSNENQMIQELSILKNAGDSVKFKKLNTNFEILQNTKENTIMNFIKSHNKSLVSLSLIRLYFDPYTQSEIARKLYNLLAPTIQESTRQGRMLGAILGIPSQFGIGSIAPEFEGKTWDGKSISLNDYKGRYVLVDFWASWCGPCREESPNLLKAFNELKNKDFTVLGFSLDQGIDGKEKWINAIKKDGIIWPQISDLVGMGSIVASKYHVSAIPANFLIDPAGKIIATNLRGPKLQEILEQIMKKNKS